MTQKRALITGGSRGIGAAIAERLAREGFHVLIAARRFTEEVQNLINLISDNEGTAEFVELDVLDEKSVQNIAHKIGTDRLDILVNNAGVLKDDLLVSLDSQDWERVLETNVWGSLRVYDHVRPALNKAKKPVVVTLGSVSGVRPRPGQGAYAVSKAMLIAWTKASAQCSDNNTNYFCISPGPVATDMIKAAPWYTDPRAFSRIPMGRFAEPTEIADVVAFMALHPAALSNGSNLVIDGGFVQTTKGD